MECRPRHSAFRGILLLLLCALLATWVKPSRGISARNPQALDLRPAPCMRQGCRQAANWKRARHSRRATETSRNEDKQRQADTIIGSRALCVPPHGCCVLSAPRLQVHSHRCSLAGRRMHTHLHQPGFRCKHAGAHRPGSRCTGSRRPGSGGLQARIQLQTCRCLPQTRLQVCRCQQARLQIYTCCPYTYPPPVTRPNPWA